MHQQDCLFCFVLFFYYEYHNINLDTSSDIVGLSVSDVESCTGLHPVSQNSHMSCKNYHLGW